MKKIAILGSTGSIGTQTVDILPSIEAEVVALTTNRRIGLLEEQARALHPKMVCAFDENAAKELRVKLADTDIEVLTGMDGLIACASESGADIVVTAVVGMVGLLPTMAAALAGCGGVFTASAWQVGTLFAADALTALIHELLLPLVYCHIALASAGAALPESGLDKLADGLKKLISWLLCGAVTAFTLYLSVSGVLTGSADRAAVKAAQTAVSGAVPVVGSILAESAEMVLSAAHSLRAAIGVAGVLGVLLACLAPLVRLGVQFLLYRAAAFVSAVSGVKPLERLLEQLGDAFALVLGMTAACAALLLAALLVSISMVVM